jgi:hypothetical protein
MYEVIKLLFKITSYAIIHNIIIMQLHENP